MGEQFNGMRCTELSDGHSRTQSVLDERKCLRKGMKARDDRYLSKEMTDKYLRSSLKATVTMGSVD